MQNLSFLVLIVMDLVFVSCQFMLVVKKKYTCTPHADLPTDMFSRRHVPTHQTDAATQEDRN